MQYRYYTTCSIICLINRSDHADIYSLRDGMIILSVKRVGPPICALTININIIILCTIKITILPQKIKMFKDCKNT